MLQDDQWRPGRKDGEGCHTGSEDEFGWAQKSVGGIAEAIQKTAGRDGEVEGNALASRVRSQMSNI